MGLVDERRIAALQRLGRPGDQIGDLLEGVAISGVRFLGATLWTDYRSTGNQPLAELDAMNVISDFKVITDDDGKQLTVQMIGEEHKKSRLFLEERLAAWLDRGECNP